MKISLQPAEQISLVLQLYAINNNEKSLVH